jgi:hypothetical protein
LWEEELTAGPPEGFAESPQADGHAENSPAPREPPSHIRIGIPERPVEPVRS